jgi:hypothetical protein
MSSLRPVKFSNAKARVPRISPPRIVGRQSSRFWTDEQKAIVRQYYPKGGYAACALHLPSDKQSRSGIYGMAHKLGVAADRGRGGGQKQVIKPPKDFDERLRKFYQEDGNGKKRGECNEFADKLKLPRWWVTKRAIKLGLTMPHKKEPPWTAAENELMKKVPLHDVDRCAKIFREHGFKRSPTAIRVRAKRLNISRRFNEGLSAIAAAAIVGFDAKNFGTYCIKGEVKATKRDDRRSPQQGGARWVIKPDDLRRFVLDNLERIDLRKVDKFAFVHLIANEPPKA